jgi:hypothetical protein
MSLMRARVWRSPPTRLLRLKRGTLYESRLVIPLRFNNRATLLFTRVDAVESPGFI